MSNPFSGNLANGSSLPYIFYVPALEPFGLQNLDEIQYQILKKGQALQAVCNSDRVIINNSSPENLTDWLQFQSLSYSVASSTSSGFVVKTLTQSYVKNLIDYLTYKSKDKRDNATYNKIIREVMSSKTKCATGTTTRGAVPGKPGKVYLYFYENSTRPASRPAGLKSTQTFCGMPRRPSGASYSAYSTREEQASLDKTGNLQIGTYIDAPSVGEHDIIHHATGPLKMHWNEDLGMWDATGHFLATLLTDVQAANTKLSSLSSSNTFDREPKEFYNNDLNEFSNFTTGLAAPLQTQNNNPYSFGPNIIKCADAKRVEQIRVVNRSNNAFKAGEVVMVFQMGAENIILPFSQGGTPEQLPPSLGRWGFAKFIATSDEYFRATNNGYKLMLPDMVSEIIRYRSYFYEILKYTEDSDRLNCPTKEEIEDATRLTELEVFTVKFSEPPQSAITDQDGTLQQPKKFRRINIYRGENADSNVGHFTFLKDVPVFWGPMFPDGHEGAGYDQPAETVSLTPFSDMLLNRPSGGFPVPDWNAILRSGINYYANTYKKPSSIFLAEALSNDISKQAGKGNYNWSKLQLPPFSGGYSAPINRNQIQFSLLSCELTGADDSEGNNIKDLPAVPEQYRKFPSGIRQVVNNYFNNPSYVTNSHKFWPRFATDAHERNQHHKKQASNSLYTNFTSDATGGPKFDEYIKLTPLNKPRGAVTLFGGDSEETNHGAYMGSNTVGIIAARNRLDGGGGGGLTINASVDQMFGMKGRFVSGGGFNNTVNLTVIPLLGGVIFGSSNNLVQPKSNDIPTWGSNISDAIDSFGTAALYAKVYDAWDDCDTLWLPQHFTVLHFNPKVRADQEESYKSKEIDYTTATWQNKTPLDPEGKPITKEVTKYNVITPFDFRVPTYRDYKELTDEEDPDNKVFLPLYGTEYEKKYGEYFSGKTVEESFWFVDGQARGKYVSDHGYSYTRKAYGVSRIGGGGSGWMIDPEQRGENFKKDETYVLDGDIRIKVTEVNGGGLQSFIFQKGEFVDSRGKTHEFEYLGSGLHDSFPMTVYLPSKTGGEPAKITFPSGQVWKSYHKTYGPKLQVPSTRLTLSSGTGQNRIEGTSEAALNIGQNLGSPYKGQYEVFFHCFNDVGFVWHNEPEFTTGYAMAQYITLTMA